LTVSRYYSSHFSFR